MLAVAFSVLKGLGYREKMEKELLERFAAGSGSSVEEAVSKLSEFVERTSAVNLGGIGALGLVLISISLFATVEQALNNIWGIDRGRSITRRAADFVSLLVFGPLLLVAGTYVTTKLQSPPEFRYAEVLQGWVQRLILGPFLSLVPYLAIWAIFIFMYSFIPNTRVRQTSALAGGLFAGTLWQLAQAAYIQYTVRFNATSYNVIYGSFSWALILLVWIYVSWIVLLLGAEISCAHQNLADRRRRRRIWGGTPAEHETLALRLAAILARGMSAPLGGTSQGLTVETAADELGLSPAPVKKALDLFESAGLAAREAEGDGYMLCRSPESVPLSGLLRLIRTGSIDSADSGGATPLDEASASLSRTLGEKKLSDLAGTPVDQIRTFGV